MGYIAPYYSSFVVVDAETGKLVSDKVYTSAGRARKYINSGAYAESRAVVEIPPEVILDLLSKQPNAPRKTEYGKEANTCVV